MAGEQLDLGTAVLELRAVGDQLRADIARVGADVQSALKPIEKQTSITGQAIGTALGNGITLAARAAMNAVGDIARFSAGVVASGDEILESSKKTGIATEMLGGLRFAAEKAGVSQGQLDMALRELNIGMTQFSSGVEGAGKGFKALGITADDVNPLLHSTDEVLFTVIEALRGIEDPAVRAAVSAEIFGKRVGPELASFVDQGTGAIKEQIEVAKLMGITFTGEAAAAADSLSDNFTDLRGNVEGLGTQVIQGLIPGVDALVVDVNRWFVANRDLLTQDVKGFISGIIDAARSGAEWIGVLRDMLHSLPGASQAAAFDSIISDQSINALEGTLSGLRSEWNNLQADLQNDPGNEALSSRSAELQDKMARVNAELSKAQAENRTTSTTAKGLADALGETGAAATHTNVNLGALAGGSKAATEAAKEQREALSDLRESLSQAEDTYKDAARSAGSLSEALDLNGEWYRKATAEVEAMNIADDEQTKLLHDLDVKHKEHARTLKEDFGQAAEEAADAAAQLTEELAGIREESNQLDIAEAIERGDPRRALGLIETGARDAAVALEAVARAEVYGPMTEQSVEAMQLGLRKIATDAKKAAEDVKREFGDLGILLEDAAKAIGDSMAETLGSALVEGEWDDVGDELLGILKSTIADVVSDLLKANLFRPLVNSLVGVFSGTDIGSGIFSGLAGTLGSVLPGAFTSGAEGASGSIVASLSPELGGTMAEVGATAGEAGGVAAGAAWTGAASAGIVAGAGLVGKGIYDMFSGQEVRGAVESGLAFAFVTGGASLIPALVMDLFGIGEPSQATQISTHLRKMIADSLGNADIGAGIVAGLGEIGVPVTEEIIKQITRAPRSGAFVREAFASLGPELQAGASEELRKFINGEGNATNALTMDDFILLLFPEMTDDSALRSSLQAIGQQAASLEGLTGRQAIDFADEFAKGQLVLADSLGLTNEQLMAYLDATANGMGASIESWRALEEAQIALKESGNFDAMLPGFQAYIQTITGVDVSGAQNLVDVLTASGLATDDFVLALRRYAEQNPAFVGAVDAFDASLEDARLTALGLTAGVRKLLETSANAALRAAETAGAGAAEAIAQAGDALALAGEQGREAVDELDAAAEAVRAAAEGASGAQQEALLALADSLDDASDGLSDTGEEGEDAGDSIADAMRDALDPVESLVGGIRELINTLRELNDLPPITLPPVTVPPPPTGPGSGPTSSLFSPGAFTIPSIDISRLAPLDLDLSRLAVRAPSFDFEGARRAPETVRAAPGGVPPVGYQLALVRDEDVVAGGLYRLQQSKRLSFAGGPARLHASVR